MVQQPFVTKMDSVLTVELGGTGPETFDEKLKSVVQELQAAGLAEAGLWLPELPASKMFTDVWDRHTSLQEVES